jgi:hypothetical protein
MQNLKVTLPVWVNDVCRRHARLKLGRTMKDDEIDSPEGKSDVTTTDWADLRARAEKLGITLSQLQQRERQSKLRFGKKKSRVTPLPKPD